MHDPQGGRSDSGGFECVREQLVARPGEVEAEHHVKALPLGVPVVARPGERFTLGPFPGPYGDDRTLGVRDDGQGHRSGQEAGQATQPS